MTGSDLRFHTEAGRLCLNCVATKGQRGPDAFERWRDAADLAAWLAAMELFDAPPSVEAADLEAARALREAIYGVVAARAQGGRPPAADVAALNRAALGPGLVRQLSGADWSAPLAPDQSVAQALAVIAADAIDLVAGPQADRIRICAAPDCTVFFVDLSRPGQRRWCSMNRCGNKAKKQALRERRRA